MFFWHLIPVINDYDQGQHAGQMVVMMESNIPLFKFRILILNAARIEIEIDNKNKATNIGNEI